MSFTKSLNLKPFHLLYYFIIYSFIGWSIETTYMSLRAGIFIKRGFLAGPFLPIYGFGALVIILLLSPLKNNKLLFFVSAASLATIVEFAAGCVLKYIFNKMWWDYFNEPFNLMGIVCLSSFFIWGAMAVFFVYVVHPYVHKLIMSIPPSYRKVISYTLILYLFIDCFATVISITGFNIPMNQFLWLSR